MSLRVKLALLLSAFVTLTLVTAWAGSRRVLAPFAREVHERYLDEVAHIASEVEGGRDPDALGRSLNLDVRVSERPPKVLTRPSPPGRREPFCEEAVRGSYTLTHCRGRRAPVIVETKIGFVVVRRDLDVGAPEQRFGRLLLVIALVIILGSAAVSAYITRPLETTTRAMERMAEGELQHRLPVSGGSELQGAARAFNAMADRVDHLLRTERELMAGISHELRTPLARLRLQLELLRDLGAVPEKRLAAMETDLIELDVLIGEVLETSRLALGDRTLARSQVELGRVVAEAIEKTPLPKHSVVVSSEDPEVVLGDHARLVRAVGNVLQNAGKYAPEGTEVTVALRGRVVEIRDHGPGVSPEELPHLFEPFYRGATARREANKPGLGLGLMIARQVATLHGGTIEASNHADGGLVVKLALPAPA